MSIQTAWKPETAKAKEIQRGTVKGVSEDMFTRRGKDTGTTLDSDRNVIMSGGEGGFSPPLLPRGERPPEGNRGAGDGCPLPGLGRAQGEDLAGTRLDGFSIAVQPETKNFLHNSGFQGFFLLLKIYFPFPEALRFRKTLKRRESYRT